MLLAEYTRSEAVHGCNPFARASYDPECIDSRDLGGDSRDLSGDSGDEVAKKPVEVVDSQCICPGRETRGGRLVFTDARCPAHTRY